MHDYQRLDVWKVAREMAADCYRVSAPFPDSETYGLQSQMRRSSVSIASNIAEGAGRATAAEFRRCVRIASGSASELETQICICGDVGLVDAADSHRMLRIVRRIKAMLHKLDDRLSADLLGKGHH